jgi:hypothetical protein
MEAEEGTAYLTPSCPWTEEAVTEETVTPTTLAAVRHEAGNLARGIEKQRAAQAGTPWYGVSTA